MGWGKERALWGQQRNIRCGPCPHGVGIPVKEPSYTSIKESRTVSKNSVIEGQNWTASEKVITLSWSNWQWLQGEHSPLGWAVLEAKGAKHMMVTLNSLICKAYWLEDLWKSNWLGSLMFPTNMKDHSRSHPQLPKYAKCHLIHTLSLHRLLPWDLRRTAVGCGLWRLLDLALDHYFGVFHWLPRKDSKDALWNSSLRRKVTRMLFPSPMRRPGTRNLPGVSLGYYGDPNPIHLPSP